MTPQEQRLLMREAGWKPPLVVEPPPPRDHLPPTASSIELVLRTFARSRIIGSRVKSPRRWC